MLFYVLSVLHTFLSDEYISDDMFISLLHGYVSSSGISKPVILFFSLKKKKKNLLNDLLTKHGLTWRERER